MAFALNFVSIVVLVQVFAVSELAAKPKPELFEYKRANFRVFGHGNETFQIKNAELEYGRWYLLASDREATAEQIDSIRINSRSIGIFGACGQAYIPKGTTGKYYIATSDGQEIAMVNFTVPFVLLDDELHSTDLPTNSYRQREKQNDPIYNTVQLYDLSKDSSQKCKEGTKNIGDNEVYLEVNCGV